MKTMTERPRSPTPAMGASGLKPYLIALLAIVYVSAWWLFGARAPARSAALLVAEPAPELLGQPRLATWYQDLPPSERPVVELPLGWHIADRTVPAPTPVVRQTPVPVRVSPARAGRVRTRSS